MVVQTNLPEVLEVEEVSSPHNQPGFFGYILISNMNTVSTGLVIQQTNPIALTNCN
jgi:hypothetical protein